MAVERPSSLINGVRRLFDGGMGTAAAATEKQLLDRFVADRDELAFAAIVARHGPMVAGVCRSVLANPADADDAFQATFLVLVEKADTFRDGAPLSPWLHGIARKVALRARGKAARRLGREAPNPDAVANAPDRPHRTAEQRELSAMLHAEVDRLSASERAAIVLCDVQGLSHREAADELGWPLGTVKARLARGRERLRGRLGRRGVTLSAAAVAGSLGGEALAAAALARGLVAATTRGAVALVAAGRVFSVGLVSPPILDLTQGAVRAMIFSKLKAGALAVAATSIVAVPSLVAYQGIGPREVQAPRPAPADPRAAAAAKPAAAPAAPAAPAATPDGLRAGMVQMAQAAVKAIAQRDQDGPPVPVSSKLSWSRRLAEAEVMAAATPPDRARAVAGHLGRLRAYAADLATRVVARRDEARQAVAPGDKSMAEVESLWTDAASIEKARDEAQQWLEQVQGAAAGKPPQVAGADRPGDGGALAAAQDRNMQAPPSPGLPASAPGDEEQGRKILAKLNERIAMNFPNETPLADLVRYVQQSTIDEAAGLPTGIPIYVDPDELLNTDNTLKSTVAINLDGIALRTSLHLALKQRNLTYIVRNGLLIVVGFASDGAYSRLLDSPLGEAAPRTGAGGFQ